MGMAVEVLHFEACQNDTTQLGVKVEPLAVGQPLTVNVVCGWPVILPTHLDLGQHSQPRGSIYAAIEGKWPKKHPSLLARWLA